MSELKAVVTTKYAAGAWRSFNGENELPNSSFKRRENSEEVARDFAENNGLIHRVLDDEGDLASETDYGKPGERGGDSELLGGPSNFFSRIFSSLSKAFRS